jgi:hypothetical protein
MFRALGVLLTLYTVYAAVTGRVYTKSGPGGRTVDRRGSPKYFWIVILIYAVLSIALIFFF